VSRAITLSSTIFYEEEWLRGKKEGERREKERTILSSHACIAHHG